MIQQSQQQRNTYQRTTQQSQQNSAYQQTSQQPSYAMEIQSVQLAPVQNQVQMTTLNEQPVHANQIAPITAGHVQNLVTVQQNFGQTNSTVSAQHRNIRPLPPVAPISTKPYKVVQPQCCYKFSTLPQSFNAQQCKFNANNFKVFHKYNVTNPVSLQRAVPFA